MSNSSSKILKDGVFRLAKTSTKDDGTPVASKEGYATCPRCEKTFSVEDINNATFDGMHERNSGRGNVIGIQRCLDEQCHYFYCPECPDGGFIWGSRFRRTFYRANEEGILVKNHPNHGDCKGFKEKRGVTC